MALTATHLADKSALARFPLPAIARRLRPLMEDGLLASCAIVDLEVLYSSRNLADYEQVLAERRSFDAAPITPAVMDRAVALQHALARHGQHRVPIPDVVVSAAAQAAGLLVLSLAATEPRSRRSEHFVESPVRTATVGAMATFTVLYTKPESDAEGFLAEYKSDHLAIAGTFPKMTGHSTTVFSGTPRGTEPPYYVMFVGTWASMDDMNEAMGDPSLMEASKHAMGMLGKYGNSAEMLIGDDA